MDYSMDRCLMKVALITVSILVAMRCAHARQCYVCGIGPTDPLYDTMLLAQQHAATPVAQHRDGRINATSTESISIDDVHGTGLPPGCAQFEQADANLDAYLVECPANYKGCFTQIDGPNTMRTCQRDSFDDCKTANRITYCYCNTDRCNGKERPATLSQSGPASVPTKRTHHTISENEEDDNGGRIINDDDDDDDDDEGDDDIDPDDPDDAYEASGRDDDGLLEPRLWSSSTTTSHSSTLSTSTTAGTAPDGGHTTDRTTIAPNHHTHRTRAGSHAVCPRCSSAIAIIPVVLTLRRWFMV